VINMLKNTKSNSFTHHMYGTQGDITYVHNVSLLNNHHEQQVKKTHDRESTSSRKIPLDY